MLHDGETGVTNSTAPNGAWNVRMRAEGVNVSDYSDADPANWTVSDPAAGVIAGRDFSAEDFNEARRGSTTQPEPEPEPQPEPEPEPQPEPEPEPQPEPELEPEPEQDIPRLFEEYAPRAALYETLPDLLLRLSAPRDAGKRLLSPTPGSGHGCWAAPALLIPKALPLAPTMTCGTSMSRPALPFPSAMNCAAGSLGIT